MPSRRDGARRARPRLEVLEDRLALAVFTVNSVLSGISGSGSSGTLAYCIWQANSLNGADTIVFDGRVFGTGAGQAAGVTLTSALPAITDSVMIQGLAGMRTLVERSTAAGTPEFGLFTIVGGVSVTLSRLEIAKGVALNGGGVFNGGDLTISECLIQDNTATGGNTGGGGVFSYGALTITDSHLRGNRSTASDSVGGGLFLFNTGGFIVNTTFEGNRAAFGGALLVESVTNDVFLDMVNVTLSGNAATATGGAIHTLANGQTLTLALTNVTVANNSAAFGTGGVYNFGRNNASANVYLLNTLLDNNSGLNLAIGTDGAFAGQVLSGGNNLADDTTGFLNQASDLNSAAARLGPLRDNGGPAPTHALLPGSQALNNAGPVGDFPVDQRGVSRPQGDGSDIGAFEAQTFLPSLTGGGQSATVNSSFANPVQLHLTEGASNPLAGAPVTFTLVSGATFSTGGTTFVAVTDGAGLATSPLVLAGDTPGLVEVRATLADGSSMSAFLTIVNAPPSGLVVSASPSPIFEGQPVTVSGTFSDLEPGEQHEVAIYWGDGEADFLTLAPGVFQFTASHVYLGPLSPSEGGATSIFVAVTDEAENSASTSLNVDVVNAAPVVSAGGDAFLNVGQEFVRPGWFTDSEKEPEGEGRGGQGAAFSVVYTATVDYGDGGGEVPLTLTADGQFTLAHVYLTEGSYEVIVRVRDSRGAVGAAGFVADVLLAGVPTQPVVKKTAGPGETVTAATTGVSATLIRAAGGPEVASILVAVVPAGVASSLPAEPGGTGTISAAYDVRTRNVGPGDRAIITFQYASGNLDLPTVTFFDRATGRQRLIPRQSYTVDRLARTVTLVLDNTSFPRLQDLSGTVFTISVPVSVGASFDPTPVAALLRLSRSEGSADVFTSSRGEPAFVPSLSALSQFGAGAEEWSSGVAGGERDGPGESRREGHSLAGELPAPGTELMGLQAATATASFPETLSEPRSADEASTEKQAPPPERGPEGPGGGPEEEGETGEQVAHEDELSLAGAEGRDAAFARMGAGEASAAEALLVIAACLHLRGRSRQEARDDQAD